MKIIQTHSKIIIAIFIIFIILLSVILLIPQNHPDSTLPKQDKSFTSVLALNTDKPSYLPGEKMTVSLASLDETGHTICNSHLKLEITDAQNITTNIDTVQSPTCGDDNVTNDPDYTASHTLATIGQYKLKLSNLDTTQVTETQVNVSANLPFDIQRSGATRINPSKSDRYPMLITVKANQDYIGRIIEKIPAGFKVIWQGPAKVEDTYIIWDVSLKSGETKTFSYEYQAPQVSPELYTLGPINIANQNIKSVWQIASDAIAIVQSAKYEPASQGTTVVLTLGSTPTVGNILVAFTAYSQYGVGRTLTAPDGTWTKVDDASSSSDSLSVWWHPVVAGNGTTYTFNITGTQEWRSGVIYELSGVDISAPINQHSIVTGASSTSIATTAITPSVLSTQALTAATTDNGTQGGTPGTLTATVSTGWTINQNASPQYHPLFAASMNALTSDTTTAITDTYTFSEASGGEVAAAILLAPATAATISISGTSNLGDGTTVALAIGNTLQVGSTAIISSGTWSIPDVTVNSGDIVTTWVNGTADADESTAVTKYDGSGNITGMVLDQHVLSIGSSDNQSLTVTNLGQYDNDDDEDIMFSANTSTLNVDAGNSYTDEKIDILSGNTLTISGTETLTTHDLAINGTLTSGGNSTYNVSGSWDNNSVFTSSTSTVLFNASTGTETIDSTGASTSTFYNLQHTGAGTLQLTTALDVNGNFFQDAGTFNTNGQNQNFAGDLTFAYGSATTYTKGGTLTFDGSGTSTINEDAYGIHDLGAVVVDGSSKTINLGYDVELTTLTIGADDTFIVDNNTLIILGTGTPVTITAGGTFANPSGGIVNYAGTGAQTVAPIAYDNLVLSNSGAKTMTNVTTMGTLTISDSATMTGNSAFTVSGIFIYTSSGSTTLTGSTNISIGIYSQSAGTFNDNGNTITITGSSTPWTKSGGTFTTSGTVVFNANADIATLLSGTVNFNNLILSPTLTANHSYTFGIAPTIVGNFTTNPSGAYRLTVYLSADTVVSGTSNLSGTGSGVSTLDTVNGQNRAFTTGILTIGAAGTLTANNSIITINGTSTTIFSQAGSFTAGGSTVVVSGTGAMSLTAATTFQNLTISGTVSTTNSFNVTGNWTNSGIFNQSAGIVTFNGSSAQQLTGGSNNFFGLSITAASARTVTITANSTLSIADNGSLNLQGTDASNRLTLQSDGTDWNLYLSTTGTSQSVSYVNAVHSNASGYQEINASNGTNTNGGSNTNWNFGVPPADNVTNFDGGLNFQGININ